MNCTLSYVNLPEGRTAYLDREFSSIEDLVVFVEHAYPNFTSFQIIVVPEDIPQ